MSGKEIAAMIIVLTGIMPCGVLGYLVAVKQKRNLIAGWDESKVSNPQAFAAVVGWSLIALACALMAVTTYWATGSLSEAEFGALLVAVSFIPLVGIVYARHKFGS